MAFLLVLCIGQGTPRHMCPHLKRDMEGDKNSGICFMAEAGGLGISKLKELKIKQDPGKSSKGLSGHANWL
jgi:hypothetical protein